MNLIIIKILIQIKNASLLNRSFIYIAKTNIGIIVVNVLYRNGLIQGYNIQSDKILILLRTIYEKTLTKQIKLVSTPSLKKYLSYNDICLLKTSNINYVFSTSKGLLNLLECKKHKIGGTLLFVC